MGYDFRDQNHLIREQYRDGSNLEARIQIYRFGDNPLSFHRWMFDRYHLPAAARVLEVGCGTGKLWLENLDRIPPGWEITLADLSPGMLDEAKSNLNGSGTHFIFRVMDVQTIPEPDGAFDAVIANHMLYHVPDMARAIGEIGRVLKPDGVLYASTLGRNHLRDLWDLVSAFDPSFSGETQLPFLLETGEAKLRRVFDRVTIERYPNTLAVTAIEPIVTYLASGRTRDLLAGPHRDEIIARVQRRFDEAGVFRITTDSGMFIARQPHPATFASSG